jgi:Protein of unknown function (DUF3558)
MSQARIAGLVFGLVAVGCGPKGDSAGAAPAPVAGPSSPSASAGSPAKASVTVDPCLLITKAEAEAALGMSVTGPETTRDESGVTCTYTHTATMLMINVGAHSSSPAALEQVRKIYGEKAKSLSGIGDAAFQGPGGMIYAVKHATFFIINTTGIISDEKFLGLARTAASRL